MGKAKRAHQRACDGHGHSPLPILLTGRLENFLALRVEEKARTRKQQIFFSQTTNIQIYREQRGKRLGSPSFGNPEATERRTQHENQY